MSKFLRFVSLSASVGSRPVGSGVCSASRARCDGGNFDGVQKFRWVRYALPVKRSDIFSAISIFLPYILYSSIEKN
jgi:hypothetical protein